MTTEASAPEAPVSVRLGAVHSWFPEHAVPLRELPSWDALAPAERSRASALGVEQVRCADGLAEVDLAARAAERALRDAGLEAGQLDALILVQGRAPRHLLASDATRLQFLLGAHRALTFGIGDLGCVSVSAALTVAAALLRAGTGFGRVMLAMGSRAATASRYRPPMTVLGDGGAAVLLTTSGGGQFELAGHEVQSEGRYSDLFRIDYRDAPAEQWREVCADPREYSFRLAVESRNRFRDLNRLVLEKNRLRTADLDSVIMQNLAQGAFAFWEDALDLRIDPVCRANLARYGHLGSIDVLLNLQRAAGGVPRGGHVLLMNSSPVAAWSSTLLRRVRDVGSGAEVQW